MIITRESIKNYFGPSPDIFMDTDRERINYRYRLYKKRSWKLLGHWGGITKQMIRQSFDEHGMPLLWEWYRKKQ